MVDSEHGWINGFLPGAVYGAPLYTIIKAVHCLMLNFPVKSHGSTFISAHTLFVPFPRRQGHVWRVSVSAPLILSSCNLNSCPQKFGTGLPLHKWLRVESINIGWNHYKNNCQVSGKVAYNLSGASANRSIHLPKHGDVCLKWGLRTVQTVTGMVHVHNLVTVNLCNLWVF